MKQDIKNISYNIKKDTEDKNLIYTIDYLLYNEIQDRFSGYSLDQHKNIDAMFYEVLEDKEGIVDYVMQEVLKDYYNIDSLKINYLVDSRFMLNANKVKRYYKEANKSRKLLEDKELRTRLRLHFNYCFNNCDIGDTKLALKSMSTQTFKDATINDLKIDTSKDLYKDFDKIYTDELNKFKKLHKDEILFDAGPEKDDKIALGWQVYGVIKIIEGLFKL